MCEVSAPPIAASNKPPAVSGTEIVPTAVSGSDDDRWFPNVAKILLGKDAGYALHLITGFPERTCYYYASGERKPPAFFLCKLLRSDQGAPFFASIMDGSQAQWWRDLQQARELCELFKIERRR